MIDRNLSRHHAPGTTTRQPPPEGPRASIVVLLTPAVALLLCLATTVRADSVTIDLEYDNSTLQWRLYAEILETGAGANGDHGLAAVRALVDNAELSSASLSANIGALDPLDAGGPNERPAILPTNGGTLDIVYGQDLATPDSVVEGVGAGGRWLIATGAYANAAAPPAFGDDDFGLTTDGNFLTPIGATSYAASSWDGVTLNLLNTTPTGLAGDYNQDGAVDAADYTVWRDNLGGDPGTLPNDADGGVIGAPQHQTWRANYGQTAPAAPAQIGSPAPEPAGLSLLLAGLILVGQRCGRAGRRSTDPWAPAGAWWGARRRRAPSGSSGPA